MIHEQARLSSVVKLQECSTDLIHFDNEPCIPRFYFQIRSKLGSAASKESQVSQEQHVTEAMEFSQYDICIDVNVILHRGKQNSNQKCMHEG